MKRYLWLIAFVVVVFAGIQIWRERRPALTRIGVVSWANSASIVGSSEFHASVLFQEDHPASPIEILPINDEWNPSKSLTAIGGAIQQGIRFFVNSHPSKCAVATVDLFSGSDRLVINTASTSPLLSGRDDYFLRIVADAIAEQRAIAGYFSLLKGQRLLVVQDTGNLPYTDPAWDAFSRALPQEWQAERIRMNIAEFLPAKLDSLMAGTYDACYVLAGSYQPSIGHLAQLFHLHHPDAPIMLTPWARSPMILEIAGSAAKNLILPSQYPSRMADLSIDRFSERYRQRFGYLPHSMALGIYQALELLDAALKAGKETPAEIRQFLLSRNSWETSLGPVTFDKNGDSITNFHFITDLERELK